MLNELERLTASLADHYRIQRELGRGGMATVYLAEDVKHRREVALKVLDPELAKSVGSERFLREIGIAARLDHPHILPLLDSGEADGFLYYVMPYVEGESLRDRLVREKQLPVEDALQITREVADALSYAHSRGVIHRDIKPENILLAGGHARVADFGIARAVSVAGLETLTATGLVVGTPTYMSPEQAGGEKNLDGRSDVYSLGCVCYEMLAGQPPFTGPTVESIVKQHLSAMPPDITAIRPAVSGTVPAALLRALAKSPADRFATAARFGEAIAGSGRIPAGSLSAHRSWWRREAVGWGLAAASLALALWGWLRPVAGRPVSVVRSHLLIAEDLPELRWPPYVAISPDGSRLVYRASVDGGTQLFVRSLSDFSARPLPGTAGAGFPFFSPDGRWVGFLQGGSLQRVAVNGGIPITITTGVPLLNGASWSSDGSIVFTDGRSGLFRVSTDGTGTWDTIATGLFRWPNVLPRGDAVLVQIGGHRPGGEGQFGLVSLVTGSVRPIDLRGGRLRYVEPGYIVYNVGSLILAAVPFDLRSGRITGTPVTLLEGLHDFDTSSDALVYVGMAEGPSALAWVDRDGEASEIDPAWSADFRTVALSSDAERVAVSISQQGNEQIWIKPLVGGPPSRLTNQGTQNSRPEWTPDGKGVSFVSDRQLYTQHADGSRAAELLLGDSIGLWEAVWSRDGHWLIFRQDGPEVLEDLLAFRPGVDSVPLQLFRTPLVQELHATLSPDARWLAYSSDESGILEVYVRPFPDIRAGKWLVSSGGGTEPLWSHGGGEIFYRNGASEMAVASVATDPTFDVIGRKVLFDARKYRAGGMGRGYDIAPDDQHFVMIRTGERAEAPRDMVLVQNFVEEIKARSGDRPQDRTPAQP